MSTVKKALYCLFFIWCFSGGDAISCDGEPSTVEGRLLKNKFCFNYDKTERPVEDHNTPVNVSMRMHVMNYDIYESKLELDLYVWMGFEWRDEFLRWDPTEFELSKLIVDSTELWKPNIVPFPILDNSDPSTACVSHKCEVKPSGFVFCVPACSYKAQCQSNTADWPFDLMNCTLYLGLWDDTPDIIIFSNTSNVFSNDVEVPSPDWKLLNAAIQRVNVTKHASLKYSFLLERHIAIYGIVLTPGFVLVIMSLVVLWMNNGTNERLYISCATCMGHFTYLEYLYWRVPYHGEQVPKMLIFFRDSLIINVLTLAFTIILRHTRTRVEQSERFMDRLAIKVASTALGRVLLQANEETNVKTTSSAEGPGVSGNDNNTGASTADGDTVNLVVDEPDGEIQPDRSGTKVVHNGILVATFMDRLMFLCCVVCYSIMICGLLPKQTM